MITMILLKILFFCQNLEFNNILTIIDSSLNLLISILSGTKSALLIFKFDIGLLQVIFSIYMALLEGGDWALV